MRNGVISKTAFAAVLLAAAESALAATITAELHTIVSAGQISSPDFLTTDGVPGDGRLFVVSQAGQIRVVSGGTLQQTPFFDASTALGGNLIAMDERGLLGLAFSPDFATQGAAGFHKVYTFTSENPGTNSMNAPTFSHPELGSGNGTTQSVIREWTTNAAGTAIDTTMPQRVLMRIRKPQTNHNGGTLVFGPDHYLYITLGDGGGGDDNSGGVGSTTDGHSNSVNVGTPQNPVNRPPGNGQDITNVYGKILRIKPTTDADPNTTLSTNGMYRIPNGPNGNRFAGATAGVDEIYAFGLRNPYRISFDRATGKLYAADVGQGAEEEIDVITSGSNYGWVLKEGTLDDTTIGTGYTVDPSLLPLVPPIAEYSHTTGAPTGIAVIGGYVSRNPLIPNLFGQYVFGDLGGSNNGKLFYMGINDPGPNPITQFTATNMTISHLGDPVPASDLHGFGEGPGGEIYAVFNNGQILQFAPLLGDLNRDFQLNNLDVQGLLNALADPAGYEAAHGLTPADFVSIGDVNGDGSVTISDVAALQRLLVGNGVGGGSANPVPEPAAWVLTVAGLFSIGVLRRRTQRFSLRDRC
jgi:glucose/arabinose dehydrogenase